MSLDIVIWTDLSVAEQKNVLQRPALGSDAIVRKRVEKIINKVRESGDAALKEFTRQLDGVELDRFRVGDDEFDQAEGELSSASMNAIELAIANALPRSVRTRSTCTHQVPAHPGGHSVDNSPCSHWIDEHPDGDPQPNGLCLHAAVLHPNGHPVPNVFCIHGGEHPDGDPLPNAPCLHATVQHPNGHPAPNAPCGHPIQQHPEGDEQPNLTCTHMVQQHPKGD